MSISKELNGNVYQIPVTDETDWGDQMTPVITNLIDKVEQVNATNPVGIQLQEKEDNGTNKVTLKAPESVTSDYTITLPPSDGIANQYLRRDSSGNMQWADGTTTATLDECYENGRAITADLGPIQINDTGGLEVEGDTTISGVLKAESSVRIKAGPIFDVTAYGAVGDGVTDDAVAIQAAIDAAGVNGTVYFPKTTSNIWCVTTALKFYSHQKWIGTGSVKDIDGATQIKLIDTSTSVAEPSIPATTTHGFRIEGIYFNAQAFAPVALTLYNCQFSYLDNCCFVNSYVGGCGLLLDSDTSLFCYFNMILNGRFVGSGTGSAGIRIKRGANCNTIIGGKASGCYNGLEILSESSGNNIYTIDFENNTTKHVYLDAPANIFSGTHMENCPIGFDLTVNAHHTAIIQPTFATNVTTQIQNSAVLTTQLLTRDDGTSTKGALGFGPALFSSEYLSGVSWLDYDPNLYSGTSNAIARFFKNTNTTGYRRIVLYKGDGTSNEGIQLDAGVGEVYALTNLRLGSLTGPILVSGSGSPESVITAGIGSVYLRTGGSAGTTVYYKETGTGNTGWVARNSFTSLTTGIITIDNDVANTSLNITQDGSATLASFTQNTDNIGLQVVKTGSGTGTCVLVHNDGSSPSVGIHTDGAGYDIAGTDSTWYVTKAGAPTFGGDLTLGSGKKMTGGSDPPASGTWAKGDICWNTDPAGTESVGWICTVAGTPGTWNSFGTIAS